MIRATTNNLRRNNLSRLFYSKPHGNKFRRKQSRGRFPASIFRIMLKEEASEESTQQQLNNPSHETSAIRETDKISVEDALNSSQDTVFTTARPKHAIDGILKGTGNILTGTLAGAAMIVSAPVAGANKPDYHKKIILYFK